MNTGKILTAVLATGVATTATTAHAQIDVQVEISNNAPTGGVALTPLWVGFHDGSFDSYNGGLSSQQGLERLAEDGDTSVISADFLGGYTYIDNSGGGAVSARVLSSQAGSARVDGTIGSPSGPPPIQPGESASQTFTIDADGTNRYFSYASMVLPSSDYYVANGNPFAHDLASLYAAAPGTQITFNIGLAGTVNDAGTEVNDFATSPGNPLFGIPAGQSTADQGAAENGVNANVTGTDPYAGFLNAPNGFDSSLLNFNDTALYSDGIATVTITVVPEPTSMAMLGFGGLALLRRRRK